MHVLVEVSVISLTQTLLSSSPMFFRFSHAYKGFKLCTTPNGEVRVHQFEPQYCTYSNVFTDQRDAYRFIDHLVQQATLKTNA